VEDRSWGPIPAAQLVRNAVDARTMGEARSSACLRFRVFLGPATIRSILGRFGRTSSGIHSPQPPATEPSPVGRKSGDANQSSPGADQLGDRAILSTTHFVQPPGCLFVQLFADRGSRREKGTRDGPVPPARVVQYGPAKLGNEVSNQINAPKTYAVLFFRGL
jgi:hypothetical protein